MCLYCTCIANDGGDPMMMVTKVFTVCHDAATCDYDGGNVVKVVIWHNGYIIIWYIVLVMVMFFLP